MADNTQNTTTCPATPRACLRRIGLGVVAAVAVGISFAALGGYIVGDFASVSEPVAEKTYLVSMPEDEALLRSLSEQLMTTSSAEAETLNTIAPAAGSPLGTLSE